MPARSWLCRFRRRHKTTFGAGRGGSGELVRASLSPFSLRTSPVWLSEHGQSFFGTINQFSLCKSDLAGSCSPTLKILPSFQSLAVPPAGLCPFHESDLTRCRGVRTSGQAWVKLAYQATKKRSATRSGSRRLPGAARRRISRNYDAPRSQIDRAPSRADDAPGALRTSAQAPRIAFPPIVGGRCAAQWLRLGLTCGAVNANEGQPPAAETGGSIPPTAILPTRSMLSSRL